MRTALVLLLLPLLARAGDTVRLADRFAVGTRYKVRTRVELTGSLTPPAKGKAKPAGPVRIQGSSSIDYEERVLALSPGGGVAKTLRLCERFDFKRTLAGQKQELSLRPAVKRLVVTRRGHVENGFSPDGPLTWGELDVIRTDVFIPALAGLLPARAVAEGDRWDATVAAAQELTDLEKVDSGGIECRLEKISKAGKRRLAKVSFKGTVKGVGEDGTATHRVEGSFHHDIEGGHMADLVLNGAMSMISPDGKEMGRIEGRFVMVRTPGGKAAELEDAALRGVKTEPDDANSRILYDNAALGVRLVHPRSWRVSREMGGQLAMDGPAGAGLLLTPDPPGKTPGARAMRADALAWLKKNKGTLVAERTAVTLRADPVLEAFALDVKLGGKRMWLDYYAARQAGGGATVSVRTPGEGAAPARRQAEEIARSLAVRAPRRR